MSNNLAVDVIVSEDIRVEINNKVSIIGYFVDDKIQIDQVGPNVYTPVAFLMHIRCLSDKAELNFTINGPSGNNLVTGNALLDPSGLGGVVHIVKMAAFPVREEGCYTLISKINNDAFTKEFSFTRNQHLTPFRLL